MGLDNKKQWRYRRYPKHFTPPAYRTKPRADIDRLTLYGDSYYYPDQDPEAIERRVLEYGKCVRSHVAHKVVLIHEFDEAVGAANGTSSRWVRIEVTNGEYHGRPISHDQYLNLSGKEIPCPK
jgi:hypothetical protein